MRSLTTKLTLAFLFVSVVGVALIALFVRQRTESEFDRFVLDRSQADLISDLSAYYGQLGNWEGIQRIVQLGSVRYPGRTLGPVPAPVTLTDAGGSVVYSGAGYESGRQLGEDDLAYAVPVQSEDEIVGWVLFSDYHGHEYDREESPEAKFLGSVNQAVVFGAFGAVSVAVIIGVLLARAISRPVREVTAATQIVAKGDLGYQVSVHTNDELGELAASFNRMSADLARGNDLRRQMTADIAHELRTPLSVILGYMEALSSGKLQATPETFDIMYAKGRQLQHLVDDLRILALADAGELTLNRRPTEPRSLLEHAALAHMVQAQERAVALRVEGEQMLPDVDVDPERIAQVLGNLVSNALRYTPAGGEIVLSARPMDENRGAIEQIREVALLVRDTGSGIPPQDLPQIFDRFYRSDKSRPHSQQNGESGLGLAIARSIVQAHGGSITVTSEMGRGTIFMIGLPVAQRPSPR